MAATQPLGAVSPLATLPTSPSVDHQQGPLALTVDSYGPMQPDNHVLQGWGGNEETVEISGQGCLLQKWPHRLAPRDLLLSAGPVPSSVPPITGKSQIKCSRDTLPPVGPPSGAVSGQSSRQEFSDDNDDVTINWLQLGSQTPSPLPALALASLRGQEVPLRQRVPRAQTLP